LAPDGVFAQWLQTYQMSFETYSTIVATFHTVFPQVLVFNPAQTSDTILVGSRAPLTLDLPTLERRWAPDPVRADPARVGLKRPEHLLATLTLGPDGVRDVAAQAPRLNTDNNMAVEFRGPRDMERGLLESTAALFGELAAYATPVEALLADPAPLLGSHERLAALIEALKRDGRDASGDQALLDAGTGG